MGSISSINFIRLGDDAIEDRSIRLITYQNLAVLYRGALKPKEQYLFSTEEIEDLADANNAIDRYSALKGQLVTVTDDLGEEKSNVKVLNVAVYQKQKLAVSSRPAINYLVHARWLLVGY